jgi:hypothetical protein
MDLEEQTLEKAAERCEECGARLTDEELRAALESDGPNLCRIHAAEAVDVPADPAADDAGAPPSPS